MKLLIIPTALALESCSLMQPRLYLEEMHESHATQHFESQPTNFGFDAVQLNLHVGIGSRIYLDLAEGATLEGCRGSGESAYCGGLFGPREEFNGRVGIILAQ